jgi:hypothetical protein
MLYTIILNAKTGELVQHSYDNITSACKVIDALNRTKSDIVDLVIVKTSNSPIVDFGNGLEWLDFLEKAKFYLAMKDHWSNNDFYNDRQLTASITKVNNYLYQ